MDMPIENILTYCVVRIQGQVGGAISTGTGFFYKIGFGGPDGGISKMYIATNKHVLKGATKINFVITTVPASAAVDAFGQYEGQTHVPIELSLERATHFGVTSPTLILHPDADVDLALIDVTVPVGQYMAPPSKVRLVFLDSTWFHDRHDRPLRAIETVKVVGYPEGLWDEANNSPIARTGSTATHPLARFKGKTNFLIDAAMFQGSSGSPIFSFESPMFLTNGGAWTPGSKASLLGILWGVIEKTNEGEVLIEEIPAVRERGKFAFKTSLNLGIALHASHLLELEQLLKGSPV